MLPRKLSFLLNAVVTTLLISGSHTALAKVSDTWEKREPQVTEAQKAADKAREDRLAEMKAAISKRNGEGAAPEKKASPEPEKKPTEGIKSTETTKPAGPKVTPMAKPHTAHTLPSAATPMAKPKPRTLQEQIALNKQKREEMNKAKAAGEPVKKPLTWQERARLAKEKREAAMKAKPDEKEGVGAHTKPPMKEEPAKTVEKEAAMEAKPEAKDGVEAHTKPPVKEEAPAKAVVKPDEKPAIATEKEVAPGDEPMKKATNRPAPPKPLAISPTQKKLMDAQSGTEEPSVKAVKSTAKPAVEPEKELAMSPTQKKLMASQEKSDSTDKPKLTFLDQIKQRGQTQ